MNRTDVIQQMLDVFKTSRQSINITAIFMSFLWDFVEYWISAFDGNQFPVPKRLLFYMNCEMIKPHSLINL